MGHSCEWMFGVHELLIYLGIKYIVSELLFAHVAGSLPDAWSGNGSFPRLQAMCVVELHLLCGFA